MLLSAATACLLLGASGAAMPNDCGDGSIQDPPVEERVINGPSCLMIGGTVTGTVDGRNGLVFRKKGLIERDLTAISQQLITNIRGDGDSP